MGGLAQRDVGVLLIAAKELSLAAKGRSGHCGQQNVTAEIAGA